MVKQSYDAITIFCDLAKMKIYYIVVTFMLHVDDSYSIFIAKI